MLAVYAASGGMCLTGAAPLPHDIQYRRSAGLTDAGSELKKALCANLGMVSEYH